MIYPYSLPYQAGWGYGAEGPVDGGDLVLRQFVLHELVQHNSEARLRNQTCSRPPEFLPRHPPPPVN